jgi:hypothetical protein
METRMKEAEDFLNYRGYHDVGELVRSLRENDQEESRYWMVLEDKFPVKNN